MLQNTQNRKCRSGAAKRRKKEEDKADEKCEGLLDRFVVVEDFHQKIGQHAIAIAGTTLHLLIYRTFSS